MSGKRDQCRDYNDPAIPALVSERLKSGLNTFILLLL